MAALSALHGQSTLGLVVLTVLTLGIYDAHYIKRQSRHINDLTGSPSSIPRAYYNAVLFSSYISAALFVPCMLLPETHPIQEASDSLGTLIIILKTIWSFAARRQLHYLLKAKFRAFFWFNAFWTLVFGPYYVNYRINKLYDAAADSFTCDEASVSGQSPTTNSTSLVRPCSRLP